MASRKEANSDRESTGREMPRADAVSTETVADQQGEPAAKTQGQLYEKCVAAERDAEAFPDLDPLKLLFAKSLFFGQPFFEPEPHGGKYRYILEFLRGCANREERLFRIAWWLKQENVCEPEDILGAKELRKMARKMFHSLSESEFRHAGRVSAWLPYFEPLLADLKNRGLQQLEKLGYESAAVGAARGRRSAVEAACCWLESRGTVDALTLKNAYSKVFGPKRLQRYGYALEDQKLVPIRHKISR
jgi:hypothetical protein